MLIVHMAQSVYTCVAMVVLTAETVLLMLSLQWEPARPGMEPVIALRSWVVNCLELLSEVSKADFRC